MNIFFGAPAISQQHIAFLLHILWDLHGVFCRFDWFQPARVYDVLGELLTVLNVFGLALCVLLTIKVKMLHRTPQLQLALPNGTLCDLPTLKYSEIKLID